MAHYGYKSTRLCAVMALCVLFPRVLTYVHHNIGCKVNVPNVCVQNVAQPCMYTKRWMATTLYVHIMLGGNDLVSVHNFGSLGGNELVSGLPNWNSEKS